MTRRIWWGIGLAALVLLVVAVLLRGSPAGAGASMISPGRLGWAATRHYLELRELAPVLRDRPLPAKTSGATLVVTYPASGYWSDEELANLDRHLVAGGAVLYAYSGRPTPAEDELVGHLRLESSSVRHNPYLNPVRWWRFEKETWQLKGAEARDKDRPGVTITAPRKVPRPPAGSRVLLLGPGGEACAFEVARGRGRLVVIPAEALANCRLGSQGNADFLEVLRSMLEGPWEVDEYRHGLLAAPVAAAQPSVRAFDALLLHLAFCYLLGVLALAHRLGPPWREELAPAGSVGPFLLGLGHLHDRLRHHSDATAAMLRHARELDARLDTTDLEGFAGGHARDDRHFLELARRLALRQRPRTPGSRR
jgi:hypothetical protein